MNRTAFANPDLVNQPINTSYWRFFDNDKETGLVYASDMKINYGAAQPISDSNPTGSRVSSTGLVLSWDGHTLRNGKAKNFADPTGATDGTLSGGVSAGGAAGIRGTATALDGVDDKVSFAATADDHLLDRTVSMWVKTSSRTAWANMFNKAGDGIYLNAAYKPYFQPDYGRHGSVIANTALTNDTWVHLVFVISGLNGVVYTNGSADGSSTFTARENSTLGPIELGSSVASAPFTYAEVRYFNRALSNTEVRQLYEDTYGWIENKANPHCKDISDTYPLGSDRVSSDGLVLSLDMEALTTDGKLKDFSGNGNHATISGAKYQRGAVKNGAYLFTAANDSMATPITADYDPVTYAFWVKPTNFSSTYSVLGKDAGDNITIEQTTGKIQFTSNGTVKATTGLTAGKVAFVIVKVNGNAVTIKVNDAANGSGNVTGRVTSSNPYKLGKFTSTAIVGTIGPTFIFSGLTTDAQDTRLYQDGQKMLGLVQGGTSNINVPGQVGQAVDLNGTSQYVEVPDCPALTPTNMTLGAWCHTDTVTGTRPIIAKASSYSLSASGTELAYYEGTATKTSSGAGLATGRWQFLAATYDASNVRHYVDGAQVGSAQADTNAIVKNANAVRFGYDGTNYADRREAFPFLFNRALSAAEIARLRYLGLSARW